LLTYPTKMRYRGGKALSLPERRFPPPWPAAETEACPSSATATGPALAYIHFEDEPGRRAAAKS
jgi:hypothetical protein